MSSTDLGISYILNIHYCNMVQQKQKLQHAPYCMTL